MQHIKKYSEFHSINESASTEEELLCRMVFKDIVNHLAGRPYDIKTIEAEFDTSDANIEEDCQENDGHWSDSDMYLEFSTPEGETLPKDMVELLIATELYDGDFAEMMSNADDEDMVLFDMMDLESPGLIITILGIDVSLQYNYYDLPGSYDAPPESECTFEEGTYSLNSPFIVNITNGDHSIELSINPEDNELKSYVQLFEKACRHYGSPGSVSFFLNTRWQGSDTAREKQQFRSKNP